MPAAADLATAELALAFVLASDEACAAPARPAALGPRVDLAAVDLVDFDCAGALIPAAADLATAEWALAFALASVAACAAPERPAALGP